MAGTLAPTPQFQGIDDNGAILVGGFLDTFLAGTLTPTPTYSDAAMAVPNTNPIVLNAGGRAVIYLDALTYKFRLRRANGTTVYTQDNIASVALQSSSGTRDLFVFGGNPVTPITVTAYPSGTGYDKMHPGTMLLYADPAGLAGAVLETMLQSTGGVTVSLALVNLSDGSPDTPMVELTSTSATGERKVSAAVVWPAGGVTKIFGIKAKVSSVAGAGFAFGARLRIL